MPTRRWSLPVLVTTVLAPLGDAAPAGPLLLALIRQLIPGMVLVAGYLLWRGARAPGGAFQAGSILGEGGAVGPPPESAAEGLRTDRRVPGDQPARVTAQVLRERRPGTPAGRCVEQDDQGVGRDLGRCTIAGRHAHAIDTVLHVEVAGIERVLGDEVAARGHFVAH